MLTSRLVLVAVLVLLVFCVRLPASEAVTRMAREFVDDHEKRLKKLDVAAGLAWWEANTTGEKAAFARKEEAQNKIDAALPDAKVFAAFKGIHDKRAEIDDPVVRRAIAVLYLLYLEKQLDTELMKKM